MLAERFMLLPCGNFVDECDIQQIAELLRFVHAHASKLHKEVVA